MLQCTTWVEIKTRAWMPGSRVMAEKLNFLQRLISAPVDRARHAVAEVDLQLIRAGGQALGPVEDVLFGGRLVDRGARVWDLHDFRRPVHLVAGVILARALPRTQRKWQKRFDRNAWEPFR